MSLLDYTNNISIKFDDGNGTYDLISQSKAVNKRVSYTKPPIDPFMALFLCVCVQFGALKICDSLNGKYILCGAMCNVFLYFMGVGE